MNMQERKGQYWVWDHGGRYIGSLFRVDVPVPDDSDIFAKWQREWGKIFEGSEEKEMLNAQ